MACVQSAQTCAHSMPLSLRTFTIAIHINKFTKLNTSSPSKVWSKQKQHSVNQGSIQLRRASSKYAVNPFDDAVNRSSTQALYIGLHSTAIYNGKNIKKMQKKTPNRFGRTFHQNNYGMNKAHSANPAKKNRIGLELPRNIQYDL